MVSRLCGGVAASGDAATEASLKTC
jgi:hypothetical protein